LGPGHILLLLLHIKPTNSSLNILRLAEPSLVVLRLLLLLLDGADLNCLPYKRLDLILYLLLAQLSIEQGHVLGHLDRLYSLGRVHWHMSLQLRSLTTSLVIPASIL